MSFATRLKKLTSLIYSPTKPASETAIRAQIDDSIQEVYDNTTNVLTSIVDGTSGADNIGATALDDRVATTIQGQTEELDTSIKSLDIADGENVKKTGAQTIADIKTFTSSPVIPTPSTNFQASPKKYVDDSLTNKADDNAVVHDTGNETVAGVKTFSSSPIVPETPTADAQTASKGYVDVEIAGVVLGQLPDNSVEEIKQHPTVKTGQLLDLDTTDKTNLVSAINEVNTNADNVDTTQWVLPVSNNRIAIDELLAYTGVTSVVDQSDSIFYDFVNSSKALTAGEIDLTKAYASTVTQGTDNISVDSMIVGDITDLVAGQEVTLQDASNKEVLTVLSVSDPTVTFTSNIVNTYSAGANAYRSNLKVDGDVWKFGGFSTKTADPSQKALLHMDGVDGSTVFTDESGKVWTANGNAEIDTAESKFGGASGLFDGSNAFVTTPDSEDFNLGSNDFTIDFWMKRQISGTQEMIVGQTDSAVSNSETSFYIKVSSSDVIFITIADGSTAKVLSTTATIADTLWHHIAIVRDGNTLLSFIDGVADNTTDVTGFTVVNSSRPLTLGRAGDYTSQNFDGNIDEFSLVNGEAKWTESFTPPTTPYDGLIVSDTPITDIDVRLNITSWEDVDSIASWLFANNNANLTLDSKLSIVDQSADESYIDLEETEIEIDASNNYYVSAGSVVTADDKVTLKYELTRTLTTDDVQVKRVQGAVAK